MSMSLVAKKPLIAPALPWCHRMWWWQVTSDHRASGAPAITQLWRIFPGAGATEREIATDPVRSWWGIFWNFKMTQSAMWCGHHHLSRIGASDISRDPGVFSVWPRWVFTMIWSIPGSIHTNITNFWEPLNHATISIQFSVSSDSLLRSSVCGQVYNAPLCCVSHNAYSVLHPFVMTWSPPHLFPCLYHSRISHRSSGLSPAVSSPSSSSVASRE